VGKLTPTALYVHESALPHLPPVLRVYEGCARAYIGAVDGANVIKLHRGTPQVSYLSYPGFEKDPHPALAASLIVPLQTFHIRYRVYSDAKNPPILHRKEEFIAKDHPLWNKFAKLTQQEERRNLYTNPELIGTREGWQRALDAQDVLLSGHRLIRKTKQER
jgi:DNA phosphorothioation-associated putative methyltransferase